MPIPNCMQGGSSLVAAPEQGVFQRPAVGPPALILVTELLAADPDVYYVMERRNPPPQACCCRSRERSAAAAPNTAGDGRADNDPGWRSPRRTVGRSR